MDRVLVMVRPLLVDAAVDNPMEDMHSASVVVVDNDMFAVGQHPVAAAVVVVVVAAAAEVAD